MNLSNLNKKELKNFINENGFFFHMQCDKLENDKIESLLADTSLNMQSTGVTVPTGEDVIVYRGIASQNYAVGEKSRNGYKYDQNGWNMTDYFINPLVLFQHDHNQPIGKATSFWLDNENNLNIMFFVYKDTLDGVDKVRVEKGLITAISTGAMTDEYMFEEIETGTMISEDDASEKYGWGNLWDAYFGCSEYLILVITKATMVENSLVTIGSNEKAMAVQNGIGQFFENKAEALKEKLGDKINERKNPKQNSGDSDYEPDDEEDRKVKPSELIPEVKSDEETNTIEEKVEISEDNSTIEENTEEVEEISEIIEIEEDKKDVEPAEESEGCEEPEGKEPLEGECSECEGEGCDACGGKKKNEVEELTETNPEVKIESNSVKISENQDEKPEITETVENTEEVVEETPVEQTENTILVKIDSVDLENKLTPFLDNFSKQIEDKFNLEKKQLEDKYNENISEYENTIEEMVTIINKVLEVVNEQSANNKVLMDNLKQNILVGPKIVNNSKKLSNSPLDGRIKGLEDMLGI